MAELEFDPDDYQLRWPADLFVAEAERLIRRTRTFGDDFQWDNDIGWLLTEAFGSTVPTDEFNTVANSRMLLGGRTITSGTWVAALMRAAANWSPDQRPRPYWSERSGAKADRAAQRSGLAATQSALATIVAGLEASGYFAQAFGQSCVDDRDDATLDPASVLAERLGYEPRWPLPTDESEPWDRDEFFDVVEVLHDVVSRPTSRWLHNFGGCGFHYSGFAAGPGRRLYRWRVNRLLHSSTLDLRLSDEGEDLGRLVRVPPTGLDELPDAARRITPPQQEDRLIHAVALFRARDAHVEQRRLAVIALAGLLEEERGALQEQLARKDEAALFEIANRFAIRHQNSLQQGDYDPAFLDWLYWWYLATLQLTHVLRSRETE